MISPPEHAVECQEEDRPIEGGRGHIRPCNKEILPRLTQLNAVLNVRMVDHVED
jgi:hypothetical protein